MMTRTNGTGPSKTCCRRLFCLAAVWYDPGKEGVMTELTQKQRQALDASREIPARVIDTVTQQVEVLLPLDDFEWIRSLLRDEPEMPHLMDPRTGVAYVVLREERYERFKAFFEDDPLTSAEKKALLREAGRRAGWDDPAWDADDPCRKKP
jgi:hypothetical protein